MNSGHLLQQNNFTANNITKLALIDSTNSVFIKCTSKQKYISFNILEIQNVYSNFVTHTFSIFNVLQFVIFKLQPVLNPECRKGILVQSCHLAQLLLYMSPEAGDGEDEGQDEPGRTEAAGRGLLFIPQLVVCSNLQFYNSSTCVRPNIEVQKFLKYEECLR